MKWEELTPSFRRLVAATLEREARQARSAKNPDVAFAFTAALMKLEEPVPVPGQNYSLEVKA